MYVFSVKICYLFYMRWLRRHACVFNATDMSGLKHALLFKVDNVISIKVEVNAEQWLVDRIF